MRTLALLLTTLAASLFAADVPRKSPEFTLLHDGQQKLLSQYRGKVCVVEFLFTTCPHCQHTAQMMSKLQAELGPRGFQAIGVAFNPMATMLVPDFVRDYGPTFPIASAERDAVLSYLNLSTMERFVVPQIVIIDRKGVIRAQSPPLGDANYQEEAYLRKLLDGLLKEGTPAAAAPPAKKPMTKAAATKK